MDFRCRLVIINNLPHIHMDYLSYIVGIDRKQIMEWLMDDEQVSVTFTRVQGDGLFCSTESAVIVIDNHCERAIRQRLWSAVSRGGGFRKLTESQKKIVAASQQWKCKMCGQMLEANFHADHIEQHCLRGNDELFNIQCLCVSCHAKKTLQDSMYANPVFEKAPMRGTITDGNNLFSKYFN